MAPRTFTLNGLSRYKAIELTNYRTPYEKMIARYSVMKNERGTFILSISETYYKRAKKANSKWMKYGTPDVGTLKGVKALKELQYLNARLRIKNDDRGYAYTVKTIPKARR